MLSLVKKYVMKKIGYESSSNSINIEGIKLDSQLLDKLTKIKDIKIDYESSELMNIIKPYVENRRTGYGSYSQLINPDYHLSFFKDLRQQENFHKSLKNVILFRISNEITFRISEIRGSHYSDFAVRSIPTQMESITQSNRDLVLLLLLIYSNISVDNDIELLKDLIKNYSGSRVKMIEKMHLLGKQGKLSIKSSECLNCIIKMSTFIEKQCRSNIVSVMNMVNSGNVDGLVKDVEARVKNLIGVGIGYDKHSPESGLQDLSIDTLVKHGLIK